MTRPRVGPKVCALEGCDRLVPSGRHKYCSKEHQKEAGKIAARERQRLATVRHPRHQWAIRICLSCERPFGSDGPWHRICDNCKFGRKSTVAPGSSHRVGPVADELEYPPTH